MGKKHLPPLPIDINNAPSPYTLLNAPQSRKRPRGGPEGSPTTSDAVVSPSAEGGLATGAFPNAPVDDRSDSASTVDSDVFSTEGDDGNQYGSNDDSVEEGEESDEELLDDSDFSDDEEGGEEAAGSSGDDDDDDGSADDIQVDFEAVEMQKGDVESIMHLLDRLIPDHLNEVDRDAFAASLLESPYTTLGKVADDDATAASGDEEEARDVIGLVSVLDVGRGLNKKAQRSAFQPLMEILKKPWTTLASGIPPSDILGAQIDGKSKSVLLVSEFINNVPLELASRILAFTVEELESVQQGKKEVERSEAVKAMSPCLYVVLAKTQRGVSAPSEGDEKKKHGTNKNQPPTHKKKGNSQSAAPGTLTIDQLVFWRDESQTLYEHRDKRVGVTVHRCRSQYEGQPESEIPLTLAFALSSEGMQQALAAIKKQETITPL